MRTRLLRLCRDQDLKGTILLAPEGINLFVAGRHNAVEELVYAIRTIPGLRDLQPKYSESDEQPFTRMLVRLKKEIIAFGVEGIDPARHTSPRIKPRELKQWLDEGRDFVLLDTRNDYEVKLGTFEAARVIGIDHFRDFPEAADGLPGDLRDKPVVTFCTGGIRCEKAAPMMEKLGFKEVYQLDGGILKYFEEVGGEHYHGECFVFDHRVGLDPALRESDSVVCFACQTPLTAEESADPRYVPNESCPYCHKPDEVKRRERIVAMQAKLDRLAGSCPGSTPEDSRKPIRIPGRCDRMALIEALVAILPHSDPGDWQHMIDQGRVLGPDGGPAAADRRVRAGEEYLRLKPQEIEPPVDGRIRLIDEDEALIVIDKPAPLPMHPCGRFRRNTMEHFLRLAWHPEVPRALHRLDANTTGVVVCARTRHFAKQVQPQFSGGGIRKEYMALVTGEPARDRFVLDAPIAAEPGPVGLRGVDFEKGLTAETEVEVIERRGDGTSLVRVRPRTGRTNQIRIHLWHAGHAIVGDPAYLPNGGTGRIQTLGPGAPPMCLHSRRFELRHPIHGGHVAFEAPDPAWSLVPVNP
ncbi:pseudouridine synthase [Verrucomicrobiaceae bacterium E54]|nr:pseudouridine synthase [Verrucomicrobiaceae bacterium E54]